MKYTEEKLKEIEEYSKWLSEQLDELCISQSELGAAVGKSQKTISRYMNGENIPNEETKAAIASYIKERSVCGRFKHIPSEEFSKLLEHLLDEFNISQSILAKKIGKYQKNISNYIHEVEKADTKTQNDILRFFLKCAPVMSSVHMGTQVYISCLLEDRFIENEEWFKLGFRCNPRHCVEYLISLSSAIQYLIIEYFDLFYDNRLSSIYKFDFSVFKSCMEIFRILPEQNKKEIVSELEKDASIEYPKTTEESYFFRQITAYRNIINADIQTIMQNGVHLSATKQIDKYTMDFETIIEFSFATDKEIIDEVKYKLTFTKYEWYIWMLLLIYDFKGHDTFMLSHRMFDMIYTPPQPSPEIKLKWAALASKNKT